MVTDSVHQGDYIVNDPSRLKKREQKSEEVIEEDVVKEKPTASADAGFLSRKRSRVQRIREKK